ncbi:conserved hypothetical protein, partial [Trichinella spiralis]|uniref:hypothetical protein n=1 Tax=Trichinella spiralis TaxID=6334 RepID=UPI0001EFEF54
LSALHKLIRLIMERQLSPVIVFSFSRKECEVQAMEISSLDLTDSREKLLIQDVFCNAIALLSEEDRKLPQLSSGEYIQMSGRAGRRGLDKRGVVILVLESSIGADIAKNIIKGDADPLNSEFRLTYNMVLNLFRVEGINPEFMLERSLFSISKNIVLCQRYMKNVLVTKENELLGYVNVKKDIEKLQEKMLAYITKANYIAPFLLPGRLLHRKNLEVNPEFVVDVLLPVSNASYTGKGDIECLRPAVPGQKAKIEIVPILLHCISKISSIRVRYPIDLKNDDSKNSVLNTLTEVKRRFPESEGGIPLLDPIKDMKINDEEFIEMHNRVELLKSSIEQMDITKDPLFEDYLEKYEEKQQVELFFLICLSTVSRILHYNCNIQF